MPSRVGDVPITRTSTLPSDDLIEKSVSCLRHKRPTHGSGCCRARAFFFLHRRFGQGNTFHFFRQGFFPLRDTGAIFVRVDSEPQRRFLQAGGQWSVHRGVELSLCF